MALNIVSTSNDTASMPGMINPKITETSLNTLVSYRTRNQNPEELRSLTAGVIGAGAGVDSAWEQKNPKPEKYLKMPQNPQRPVHALLARFLPKGTIAFLDNSSCGFTQIRHNFVRFHNLFFAIAIQIIFCYL